MRPAVTEHFLQSAGNGTWVGPAPRLRFGDEFTAYAQLHVAVSPEDVAIRCAATSARVDSVDITVQLSCNDGLNFFGAYLIETDGDGVLSAIQTSADNSESYEIVAPNVWATHTFHLTDGVDYIRATVDALLAAGTLGVVLQMGLDGASGLDAEDIRGWVSQLDLVINGETWLRNWPRPDAHGAGNAPRNWPTPTKQSSIRGFGAVP